MTDYNINSCTGVMYHYVRNSSLTPYPGIKGESEDAFIRQVKFLKAHFELPNAETFSAWLNGAYTPKKPMTILSFDDGLKEHAHFVTEVLSEEGIMGQFFIVTQCITENKVLPVHKNHFLLASLSLKEYSNAISLALQEMDEDLPSPSKEIISKTYRWDSPEVGRVKYILNYALNNAISHQVLDKVFSKYIGNEAEFSKELYAQWEELRKMQLAGQLIGGHTHQHQVLSKLTTSEQTDDLTTSTDLLHKNLDSQNYWPFAYPFGKKVTYDNQTISILKKLGYHWAFTSERGPVTDTSQVYELSRIDPKDLPL